MTGSVLDGDTLVALREILDEPSLPVGTTAEGPEGIRVARLREALDHLVTVRAGAAVLDSPEEGARLVHALEALDVELAAVLDRHVRAVRTLSDLAPGRARNAVLGDVGRGDLIAFAEVRAWLWDGDRAPDAEYPLRQAHGALVVADYPGLYDTVLARRPDATGLVAVSTHRQGLAWTPIDGSADWAVALDAVTFHADDLIDFGGHPPPAHTPNTEDL